MFENDCPTTTQQSSHGLAFQADMSAALLLGFHAVAKEDKCTVLSPSHSASIWVCGRRNADACSDIVHKIVSFSLRALSSSSLPEYQPCIIRKENCSEQLCVKRKVMLKRVNFGESIAD
jgi:hypothetical protein